MSDPIELLIRARRLNNRTMKDADECAQLHRDIDALLDLTGRETEPKERWDDPVRVQHRQFVKEMFRRWK